MENAGAGLFLPRFIGVTGGDFVFARASKTDLRWAVLCAALIVVQFFALLPFGHERTPWVTTGILLVPIVLAGTVGAALIAVYFFWQEFVLVGRIALFLVGAGYLVRSLLPMLQDWPDPHDIARGSVLGTAVGPAVWLLNHAFFAIFVITAFVVRYRFAPFGRTLARRVATVTALGVPLLVVALGFALHALRAYLPPLISPDLSRFTGTFVSAGVVDAVLCVAALVAVGMSTRFQTLLGCWISVSVVAVLCENLLMTVFPERPSIGFWTARVDALLANCIIAAFFLRRSGRLNQTFTAQRRWLSSVVDNVADALITLDAAGAITWCNRSAEAMFGTPYGHIVGSDVHAWLPAFERANSEASASIEESTALRNDGSTVPVEIAQTALFLDDMTIAILIVRDITARKRGEEAMARARDQAVRAARTKADFLATMSHEIRTPINAIVGMSELLAETLSTPQQREYAQTVHSSAQALRTIIDDVLDVSKLEAGKLELEAIPFNVLDVVEAAADIVAGEAHRKHIELITFVDPDVPDALWGDPNRLRQVLLNLLGNAVKFTDGGRVVVRAMLDEKRRDAVTLRFEVEDTGIGIAPESQQRLFLPFEQVDQTTSRRYGGTGLGLSISRRLVALMGGEMGLCSDLGHGSTFWFDARFPRVDDEAEPRRPHLDPMRVLIVGGDPVWRDGLARTMRAWSVDVEAAGTAQAAIERLEVRAQTDRPFDVVVIESNLSDATGPALSREITTEARFGKTRSVLVTGYSGATVDFHTEDLGFVHFLRKPIRQEALLDALTGEKRAVAAPRAETDEQKGGGGFRILLVEDHPVNRKVALRQLQRLGYEADVATNGREALEAAARTDYDLVLMDCQMPDLDGFEATREIRRREGATGAHVFIVAMTANAMEGDRETCLAAGMDGYLAKPVTLDDLRGVLAQRPAARVPQA
jgi:PAS domain S-box-containing protein